jgi:hypothetical protein
MKILQEKGQSNCLIEINQKYSEWQNNYTLNCRIGLRIFSWIFPAVLKINLIKD